jgi:hypothetical protein
LARRGWPPWPDRAEGAQRPDGELRQDPRRGVVEGFHEIEIVERRGGAGGGELAGGHDLRAAFADDADDHADGDLGGLALGAQLGLEIDDLGDDGEIAAGAQGAAADVLKGVRAGRARSISVWSMIGAGSLQRTSGRYCACSAPGWIMIRSVVQRAVGCRFLDDDVAGQRAALPEGRSEGGSSTMTSIGVVASLERRERAAGGQDGKEGRRRRWSRKVVITGKVSVRTMRDLTV